MGSPFGFGFTGGGSGGGSGTASTKYQHTVSAQDVINGYITVVGITLSANTRVFRGGTLQDNSTYIINSPTALDITFSLELVESEVIQVFN